MNITPKNDNAPGQGCEVGKAQTNQFELCFARTRSVNPPTYPSVKFLPGRVLAILLQGRRFSHLDSWKELGHSRLADSIWKLIHRFGWDVKKVEELVTTGDAGRPANIALYFLTPETIAEAGERGRQYVEECAQVEAERRAA